MAISLSRYVNINSSVGSGNAVPTRLLIGRMFTGNVLLPPNSVLQFSNFTDVGNYFGINSEEYYRAVFYFSWASKSLTSPQALQFARYVPIATAPMIYPIPDQTQDITAWQAISAGSFGLTIGGVSNSFSSLDFSAVTNFTDVAAILQTAVRTGTGVQWTAATVVFQNGKFVLTGGSAVDATISVQAGVTGTDITGFNLLGWFPGSTYSNFIYNSTTRSANALWLAGVALDGTNATITAMLNASVALNNNFGSLLFLNNLNLTSAQAVEIATWNAGLMPNNQFLYTVPVIAANVSAWQTALNGIAGTSITLSQTPIVQTGSIVTGSNVITGLMNVEATLQRGMPVSGTGIPTGSVITAIVSDNSINISQNATATASESITFSTSQFPEQAPMMIEAATNYNGINTVQNYMFQNFDPYLTPLVTSDSQANSLDALSVNYYGQTQTAGLQFNFYQRGLMQAASNSPTDQNIYVNEIWLKDALAAALMGLLLGLNQLPANPQGQALALLTIQGVINQALLNGVISVGKTLSTAQIVFITSVTNDENAHYQVQNSGYWVDCIIQPIPNISPIQYEAAYTLVYSKDDVIRYVTGQDILI